MSALGHAAPNAWNLKGLSGPAQLALVRIGAEGGATRSELANDLAPLFTHKLSQPDWRRLAEELAKLVAAGLITETRSRLSPNGRRPKRRRPVSRPQDVRGEALAASCATSRVDRQGLGLEKEPPQRLKPLARVEGLRALIVQKAFGLPAKKNQQPAKLRAQLAVVALERAFGNRIKAGFGKGSALSSKAGRLLAGQLSRTPRAFSTTPSSSRRSRPSMPAPSRPILMPCAPAFCAVWAPTLSRHWKAAKARPPRRARCRYRFPKRPPPAAPAANDRAPTPRSCHQRSGAPDLGEFSRAVKDAALKRAEGWPGSRKAYISHVWDVIRAAKPRWELSEIEFKCMLAEAHRLGAIALANADLKDKKSMKELESSAVPYKNTVWHFVSCRRVSVIGGVGDR